MNSPTICILINGKARSGKDTIANYIKTRYPSFNFKRYALADGVRDTVATLYDISPERVYDDNLKECEITQGIAKGQTVRQLLQLIGHGMKSWIRPTIWCERLFEKYSRSYATPYTVIDGKIVNDGNIIISDCRYPDEIEFFKRIFNKVIIIGVTRNITIASKEAAHPGENYDVVSDYRIMNDSSLEYLYSKVDAIIERELLRLGGSDK